MVVRLSELYFVISGGAVGGTVFRMPATRSDPFPLPSGRQLAVEWSCARTRATLSGKHRSRWLAEPDERDRGGAACEMSLLHAPRLGARG